MNKKEEKIAEKRILSFCSDNFKDIFVKTFNEYNVENKFNIMFVEEERDEKCFNLFKILKKSGEFMFLNVDWSIAEVYKVKGENEKEYKIKMVIELSRENTVLRQIYYFNTFLTPFKFDGGIDFFRQLSQIIIKASRVLLAWDICEKESEGNNGK